MDGLVDSPEQAKYIIQVWYKHAISYAIQKGSKNKTIAFIYDSPIYTLSLLSCDIHVYMATLYMHNIIDVVNKQWQTIK